MIPPIDGGEATRLDWIALLIRDRGVVVDERTRAVSLGTEFPWLTCDLCGAGASSRIATNGGVVVCETATECRERRRGRDIHRDVARRADA
jgi:hypothetical protein